MHYRIEILFIHLLQHSIMQTTKKRSARIPVFAETKQELLRVKLRMQADQSGKLTWDDFLIKLLRRGSNGKHNQHNN